MPVIRHPGQLPTTHGPGWHQQDWAGAGVFGEPVPMISRLRWDVPGQYPHPVRSFTRSRTKLDQSYQS